MRSESTDIKIGLSLISNGSGSKMGGNEVTLTGEQKANVAV